jgi:hypothetical protein
MADLPRRGAYLVSARPLLELRERYETELEVLRRRAPRSDVTVTLATCVDDIAEVINSSAPEQLYITVDDAMKITGRCRSAITRMCRTKGALVGARREGGVWSIDSTKFQAYLAGARSKGGGP